MTIKVKYYHSICFILLLLLMACSSRRNEDLNSKSDIKFNKNFPPCDNIRKPNMPPLDLVAFSPLEMPMFLKKNELPYNISFITPTEQDSTQSTTQKMIALGILTTDLAYACAYRQPKIAFSYLKNLKQETEKLTEDSLFNLQPLIRNKGKETFIDTLNYIATKAINKLNISFFEQNHHCSNTLINYGIWLEGLYFVVENLDKTTPQKKLVERIAEQGQFVQLIIASFESIGESDELTRITNELKELEAVYSEVLITVEEGETQTVNNFGHQQVIVQTDRIVVEISDEQLSFICLKVKELRDYHRL